MIGADIIRGQVDIMILSVLQDGPSYGYEISRRIRQIARGDYTIKETTLYSAFARLERSGSIVSFSGEVTHGRPRTYYRLSEAGQAYFRQRCDEWRLATQVITQFIPDTPR